VDILQPVVTTNANEFSLLQPFAINRVRLRELLLVYHHRFNDH
jgi:hypothetical protein